jgi:hypothetical protein
MMVHYTWDTISVFCSSFFSDYEALDKVQKLSKPKFTTVITAARLCAQFCVIFSPVMALCEGCPEIIQPLSQEPVMWPWCNLAASQRRHYCASVNSHFPVGLVSQQWDAINWACVLCDRHIHNDRASRSASSWQCACPFYSSRAGFFGKASYQPGLSAPPQPRFGSLWLPAFPKAKIWVEREEIYECDGHTVHKLSQWRLTADWLAPRENYYSRMRSKVSFDWLPSYIKGTRPVLEIFKMAGYFLDGSHMLSSHPYAHQHNPPKLHQHPSSATHAWPINMIASALYIYRPTPPSKRWVCLILISRDPLNPLWSNVGPRPTLWFSCSVPMSEDVWHFFCCVCSSAPLSEPVQRFSSCSMDK